MCPPQLGYFRAMHASPSVTSSPSSRYSGADDSFAEDEDDSAGGGKCRQKAGDSNSKRSWTREVRTGRM